MAIIKKPNSSLKKPTKNPNSKPSPPTPNPFTFWFYFTLTISLLTLIFITISSLTTHQDPKSWFLTLPTNLRTHYSNGRIIKVQPTPHSSNSIELFTIQSGPLDSSHKVLIVHGLASTSYTFLKLLETLGENGVNAVAIDLPGSGFSDKSVTVTEEKVMGGFDRILDLYNEIKEKGIFWGFDQLVENGYVNYDYEENAIRVSKVERSRAIELGPEEMGRVLGEVIETLGLAPVDLVLHDSAFGLGANWVAENLGLVSSVTILDGSWNETAFPLWVLRVPVVREVVSGLGFVFENVVRMCCLRSGGGFDVEGHRLLLKGRNGLESVVGMGKKMNHSFSVAEWGKLVKDLPMKVIWAEEGMEQGKRVAGELNQATFVTHSGGRWPEDDTAEELSERIYEFVSKLAKPVKVTKKKEHIPEHIRQMVDEATANVHHHGLSGHDHSHSHVHGGHDHSHGHGYSEEVGYPNAYGLGNEFS